MLDAGELAHVRSDLADHGQRGGHVHAVDARQVHAAQLEQLRAQIELRRIAGTAALLALGRVTLVNLEALQLPLDLGVALGQLRAHEVERGQGLLERKQVFGADTARTCRWNAGTATCAFTASSTARRKSAAARSRRAFHGAGRRSST